MNKNQIFERFIAENKRKLENYIYRHAYYYSYEDRKDLLQDSLLRIYRFFDHNQQLTLTYCYKTITGCIINNARAQNRRPFMVDYEEFDIEDMPDRNSNPQQNLINKEYEDQINQMIKQLSPIYQQMLTLRYIEERSYKEISHILNIPLSTVRSRIRRLSDKFRRYHQKLGNI